MDKEKTTQPVTEKMIGEYPHFNWMLAKEIYEKLTTESLLSAEYIIGIEGETTFLAYSVVRLINKYRQEIEISDKKECSMMSRELWEHEKEVFPKQIVKEYFKNLFGKGKKIVFVHCLFDPPTEHPNQNIPWVTTKEALIRWKKSEKAKNEDTAKKLAKNFSGKLCQSIVLPVPREQYKKFLKKISS